MRVPRGKHTIGRSMKVRSLKNGISDLRWSDKGTGWPVSHSANHAWEPWESAMTCLTDSHAWRTSPMRQSVSQFPLFFAWSDSDSKRSSLAAALCTGKAPISRVNEWCLVQSHTKHDSISDANGRFLWTRISSASVWPRFLITIWDASSAAKPLGRCGPPRRTWPLFVLASCVAATTYVLSKARASLLGGHLAPRPKMADASSSLDCNSSKLGAVCTGNPNSGNFDKHPRQEFLCSHSRPKYLKAPLFPPDAAISAPACMRSWRSSAGP